MAKQFNTIPKRILVFNNLKRLVGVFQSQNAAAKVFNTHVQSIHYACTGQCISCQGYYFRSLDETIEVTWDDLGELQLEEYDKLCGVERKTYKTGDMSRTGMTYKKHYVSPKNKSKQ